MTRVACVMMQRDENELLEPWLAYHGYLFGLENLYVIDNGSASPAVLETLQRYGRAGVTVDRSHETPEDFEAKGEIVAETIRRLHASRGHDIYFPLDCDEFVIYLGGQRGVSCRRSEIDDYLSRFDGKEAALQINSLFFNVPGLLDKYYIEDQGKVFFAGGDVVDLEHGFHNGSVHAGERIEPVSISYIHLHNRPFRSLQKYSREKMKRRVDINDLEAVRSYQGHGDHLVKYFSMNEQDYIGSFSDRMLIRFPEFRQVLAALKVETGLNRVCMAEAPVQHNGLEFPADFDADLYLLANDDVGHARIPPLLHYYQHGIAERRQMHPVRLCGERPKPVAIGG